MTAAVRQAFGAKVYTVIAVRQVDDTEQPEEGEKVQACIFKVGDDCRQDVLALQVVRCCLAMSPTSGPAGIYAFLFHGTCCTHRAQLLQMRVLS